MTPSELLSLLFAPRDVGDGADTRAFLKAWGPPSQAGEDGPSFFARLVRVAQKADRRAMANAAGHQAAIRRLFPQTPPDAVVAFCVSEEHGPRPSKIVSSLQPAGEGYVLNGLKKWGSMSPVADLLYIAASIGQVDGRNQLRMVAVPTDRAGLLIDEAPYADYREDILIADIALRNVAIAASEIINADAYEAYIKPFRLIEDVYNTVGTQIGLLRLGLSHGWPQAVLEDLTALILQAHALSETSMSAPQDVIAMSAYFRASGALWDALTPHWAGVPDPVKTLWRPDVGTLGVAARARETRRLKAWQAVRPDN
ncbi:MAG: hypothetical protein AAGA24_06755 [Pseudomonadota bacterium]